MKRSVPLFFTIALIVPLMLVGCTSNANSTISASGTLSAVEISISPEVSGRVVGIHAEEGDAIEAGDLLFQLDDEIIQAQHAQAQAAVDAATATITTAKAQLLYAQRQHTLALQGARAQDAQSRFESWNISTLENFQPSWYFQRDESIVAAEAEVEASQKALMDEQSNLNQEIQKISNQDFIAAEKRLAQAQAAFTSAQATLNQAKFANNKTLKDAAQNVFDLAESDLRDARLQYSQMLSTSTAENILEARARVAVAQARFDNARDALSTLQTGDESNQVSVAEAGVKQAEAALEQAEANLNQAQAALALVVLQLDRTSIKAPIDGVVLARNLEVGELIGAGGIVMSIGEITQLDLTVFVPENLYGQISLGQKVEIETNSFPDEIFLGTVSRIANQAEFTPRNVQTADSRATTVYAIKINVPNSDSRLKPGMPVDVTFVP